MARGLDFSELKAYAESLKEIKDKRSFEDFLKRFLIENAELVVTLAKGRTPVDTGALRATWGLGDERYQELASMGGLMQEDWTGQERQYKDLGVEIVAGECFLGEEDFTACGRFDAG